MLYDLEVIKADDNLFAYCRNQNEYTGNVSGSFRRIYHDNLGYYCKSDGRRLNLNHQVEAFRIQEDRKKEAMDFFRKYNGRIF